MGLKDYWTQPAQAQDNLIASVQPTPAYLKPKGCKCHMPDARDCWVQKHGAIARWHPHNTCPCACHYETGGFD